MKKEKKKREWNGMQEINLDFEKCSNLPNADEILPNSLINTFPDDLELNNLAWDAVDINDIVYRRVRHWILGGRKRKYDGRFGF